MRYRVNRTRLTDHSERGKSVLEGREDHGHGATLEGGLLVGGAGIRTSFQETFNDLTAVVQVAHFATLELHNDLDLVSVGKELVRVVDAGFKVVGVDGAGKLNFLDLDDLLILAGFLFLLDALETVFTVVHDAAYRGFCVRRDHDEVKILLFCHILCHSELDDTDLLTVRTDQSDFICADLLIDLQLFCANNPAPPFDN